MFSYFASVPQTSFPVAKTPAALPSPVAVPATKLAPRRGHVVVAGRYTTCKELESEVALERTVLGEGMSSAVRLAKHVGSGRQFAVKSLAKDDLEGDRLIEVRSEVEIHLILDHPHIARLEGVYETDSAIHMVIEHLAGPELFDKIVQRGRFTEKEAADAMRQMLLPVQYMHGHGLVHRDLKPENFMYEAKGSEYLKLIDFGFARRFDSAKDENMSHLCGTLYYMAPEVVAGSYTEKADMWSLGVILYTMLCGGVPWCHNDQKTLEMVRAGTPLYGPSFKRLSQGARKLIKSLLSKDPAHRPSAADALCDPWFEASGAVKPSSSISSSVLQSIRDFAKTSLILRHCATMTAWSCSKEDQAKLREQFLALSMDESGAVTSKVFIQAMKCACVEVSEAENLFRCLDVDGDGEIAFSEFLAGASQFTGLAADTMHLSFGRFDVDGDGKITSKDLRAILGKSFFKTNNVEDWLLEFGDSDGTVSLEMFSVFMRQSQELPEDANKVRTRSVSVTSMQSQDQDKSTQKSQGLGEPAKQSGGKNLLGIAAPQPEKSAHSRATQSFSNQLCVN